MRRAAAAGDHAGRALEDVDDGGALYRQARRPTSAAARIMRVARKAIGEGWSNTYTAFH
jgi:hypothetical protein